MLIKVHCTRMRKKAPFPACKSGLLYPFAQTSIKSARRVYEQSPFPSFACIGSIRPICKDVVACVSCFMGRGVNPLTDEKLNSYLSSNLTVIAMWSNKDCVDCDVELYTLFKMVYSFSDKEEVVVS